MKKIIFFELNEVPWRIIQDFTEDYPESSLAKILYRSRCFETVAEDSELSPWVTWPSVHRGVSDKDHEISNFGQELKKIDGEYPPVWKILAASGISTGIFGSLHTHPLPIRMDNYSFYVPDVFAAGPECFPKKVCAYQQWNLEMSRGSARNVSSRFPLIETAKFLRTLPGLGVRAGTLAGISKHLLDERRENWKKVRRRSQQVILAFDVFMKHLCSTKPAFSTFFTNHVASTMHRYWAAKYPNDYDQIGYSGDWLKTYDHEIDWTLGKFDKMLERLLHFIQTESNYELWVASSMGQAATTAEKPASRQTFLTNLNMFMSYFGFEPSEYNVKPTMAPRHVIKLTDIRRNSEFEQLTKNIKVSNVEKSSLGPGEKITVNIKNLDNGVFMIRPPVIQNHAKEELTVSGVDVKFSDLGFSNTVITDQTAQTAYHIPHGSLLIYTPSTNYSDTATPTISSLDIAPALLDNFGVTRPGYMNNSKVILQ